MYCSHLTHQPRRQEIADIPNDLHDWASGFSKISRHGRTFVQLKDGRTFFVGEYENATSKSSTRTQNKLRILMKNNFASWAQVTPSHADWFCHRSLLQRSNRHVKFAVQRLDFLLNEARTGYWRASVLHRKHVSKLLTSLQDRILGFQRERRNELSLNSFPVGSAFSRLAFVQTVQSSLPLLPAVRRVSFKLHHPSFIPPTSLFGELHP